MMEFVNGKDDIPYILENKKCSKPPPSLLYTYIHSVYIYIYYMYVYIVYEFG